MPRLYRNSVVVINRYHPDKKAFEKHRLIVTYSVVMIKQYHPDKNDDKESHDKFQAIAEGVCVCDA